MMKTYCFLLLLCINFWIVDASNFSFVQLTDIHCGFDGYVDGSFNGKLPPIQNLKKVVAKVNEITLSRNIKFAFVTGDLAHNGFTSEFSQVKELLDTLFVSYFPIVGNHDIWWSNVTGRTPMRHTDEKYPTGDFRFCQLYCDCYNSTSVGKILSFTGQNRIMNQNYGYQSNFMNFHFEYENIAFLSSDWNSREHNKLGLGFRGAMPGTEMDEFKGGTMTWFKERIKDLESRIDEVDLILFVQHHPFFVPAYIPQKVWSFSKQKKEEILSVVSNSSIPVEKIYGDISGHLHMWFDKTPFDDEWKNYREWQTAAIKDKPVFSIVDVVDGKVTNIEKVILD